MKNPILVWYSAYLKINLTLLIIFSSCIAVAQVPGEWVWKSGSNAVDYVGNYGTIGLPDSSYNPPGLYEACEWLDKDGNFWLYGGESHWGWTDDLWKYNPATNEWTWVKGHHAPNERPVYSVQGVPSIDNEPGERSACFSWVDSLGNLWLYGGISFLANGTATPYSDLWEYNIASNMWTWMKGDSGIVNSRHYGIQSAEDSINRPPSSDEDDICWAGDENNLWMVDNYGCLWQYKIQDNNWIWMKGDTGTTAHPNPNPVYGTKGIPGVNNTPGFTAFEFARWKDNKGNFWFLAGQTMILWEYKVDSNMWTWVDGDTTFTGTENYGNLKCEHDDESVEPSTRDETRACWIDSCNNLWAMGGYGRTFTLNDLIYYNIDSHSWVWVDNDTIQVDNSVFGTKNIPDLANMPCSRMGALPFKDAAGNLWMYGGLNYSFGGHLADLWMYTIDTACTKCYTPQSHTGIQNINKLVFSVSPNPATDEVTITYNAQTSANTSLSIINLTGQTVIAKNLGKTQSGSVIIPIEQLPAGIYALQLNSGTDMVRRKLVKQY